MMYNTDWLLFQFPSFFLSKQKPKNSKVRKGTLLALAPSPMNFIYSSTAGDSCSTVAFITK